MDSAAVQLGDSRPSGSRWFHGLAVAVFLLLTVALTWPLTREMATKIALHPRRSFLVSYHHIYVSAWYHHVFDEGLDNYWNTNVFYPHPRTLTYSESLLVPSVATWPVHLATRNATLCYNLIVLGAFFLNGLCTYVFALEFGLSRRLALLAGGALAFCPFMLHEIYCPIMLQFYPVPLLLAALHRLIRRPSWPGAILVGVCGLWLLTTCYQYTLFCALFCVLWVAWFARRLGWRRLWYKLLVVGSVCAVPAWALLSTVKATHREMGFSRTETIPLTWSELLLPAKDQRLYRDVLGIRYREKLEIPSNNVCFPGLTITLLALVGTVSAVRRRASAEGDAYRSLVRRFCVVAGAAGLVLSLGSSIHLGSLEIPGPYALLSWVLPPFGSVRSVYRFFVFGQFFAVLLAGLGLQRCAERAATRWGRGLIGLGAVVLLLAESIWVPLNLWEARSTPSDVHPLYEYLAQTDPNAPLIEVPVPIGAESYLLEGLYIFSTIHTWQPLVNGYASYSPGLYEELRPVMAHFPSTGTLRYLRALGVRYVLVRESHLPEETVLSTRDCSELRKVQRHESDVLYALGGSERRSLNDRKNEARLLIVQDPDSESGASVRLEFGLKAGEVIPVLPGDRATRFRLVWRDGSSRVVKTQLVAIRNSRWLTPTRNHLSGPAELPDQPGQYTVEAINAIDDEVLGSCRVRR